MQILLSCAKDMASTICTYKEIKGSTPLFEQQARELAASMSNYSWEELGQILQINDKLAHLNRLRYLNFLQPDEKSHAVLAFTGMAYRHLKATDFDKTEADFAVTNQLVQEVISLPMHTELEEEQIAFITDLINKTV